MRPPRLVHCAVCGAKLVTSAPPIVDEIVVCRAPACVAVVRRAA